MPTYKGTVTVPFELRVDAPQTAAEVRASVVAAYGVAIPVDDGVEPEVGITWPMCVAIARRNRIDGQLYMCEMPEDDGVHGPVTACEPTCLDPGAHHDYEGPGFDAPLGETPNPVNGRFLI